MYARSHKIKLAASGASGVLALLFCASVAYAQTNPNVGNPPSGTTNTTSGGGGLSRDGIFGCRAAQYANIGTLTAIGGVYVPVNDAAVTLNTGYLVYKECVLDGVVSAIKNDIAAGLQSGAIRAVETSRGGNRQYYTNREDLRPDLDAITVEAVTAAKAGTMCSAYKDRVATAVARNYYSATREGASESLCPFISTEAEREAIVSGAQAVNWSKITALVDPRGYELGAYNIQKSSVDAQIMVYEHDIREQLQWGNGFFPALDNAQNPLNRRVLTPGFNIAQSLQRMLGVGTDILIQADEIDKINGSLQAGLQSSLIADTIRGLTGFARSQNGQPSYLDRMSAEASSAVRANAVNAALAILAAARQVETTYKNAKEAIAAALTDAITKLRQAENTCWGLVVPAVRDRAANQGVSLRIATTTEFSQKVIDEQVQPLATVTIRDLRASEQALNLINQLISSVTNTSSAAAQRAALERLDSMVANNQMHSASEANTAQKQKDEVTTAIGTLVEETLKEWGDSTEPEVGWCNVNNEATLDMWISRWRI
jgi:hypothetical protein